MDGTILSQGTFTQPATAVAQTIAIPSGTDFLRVFNYTQMAAGTSANYGDGFWQRGMGTTGLYRTCAGVAAAFAANSFVLYNPATATPGAAVAITNINAGTGLVLTGSTAGVVVGSMIRLSNLSVAAAQQWAGLDFQVTVVVANTSFTIVPLTPAAAIGAVTGFYRLLGTGLFYPRRRFISNITAANPGVVTTTVAHGYQVGQEVRFVVPTVTAIGFGMTQLDGTSAVVTAVTATTFTINVDTSGFTAFGWPVGTAVPFSPAEVVPFGDDTATALAQVPQLSSLEDAVYNSAFLGMTLAPGATSPAGAAADVIYWVAGKSTLGGS